MQVYKSEGKCIVYMHYYVLIRVQKAYKSGLYLKSNSFNDLQDDYNDLYEESLKMINKNCMLRK